MVSKLGDFIRGDSATGRRRSHAAAVWRRPWLLAGAGLLLIGLSAFVGVLIFSSSDEMTSGTDGALAFSVTRLECIQGVVGNRILSYPPNGKICVVDITVENTGSEPATFRSENQLLIVDGRRIVPQELANQAYEFATGEVIYKEMEPGVETEAVVLVDIPLAARPEGIEVHESKRSEGVELDLVEPTEGSL